MILRRFLRLFVCVFVCLFALSSNLCYAQAQETEQSDTFGFEDESSLLDMRFSAYNTINYGSERTYYADATLGVDGIASVSGSFEHNTKYLSSGMPIHDEFIFYYDNYAKKVLLANYSVSFNITSIDNYITIPGVRDCLFNGTFSDIKIGFEDLNGHIEWVSAPYSVINNTWNFNLSISDVTVPFDTFALHLKFETSVNNFTGLTSYLGKDHNFIKGFGFSNSTVNIATKDEKTGMLGNIVKIVTNIKEGITELPNKISNGVKGFFDNVVESVTNLGNFLLEGIKNLFVPSEKDITDMQEDWETLLEQRFGGLYEAVDIVDDYASSFVASEKKTIEFPVITIPLGDTEFNFGGWNVQVVPNGFDILINALKMIISIVCTFAFVNGLKTRFEKLIGGSNNI